jgi:uncharacterized protein (DUF58 family)
MEYYLWGARISMSSRLQLKSHLLPGIVIALFIMQLINPSRVWTVLLVGLGGVWIISFIWARELSRHFTFLREIRYGWVQVGDVLEERFTLENKSIFPATWLEIEDHSNLPGYNASIATGVAGHGSNQWRKRGACTRRGLYFLGDTLVHTGDPFGIYTVAFKDSARASLMVLPPIVPLPTLEIVPGGFSGDGRLIPHALEDTINASSIREYFGGDSKRLIHWKATAHHGKLFVRLFDGAPGSDWWILLDLQDATQVGKGEDSTEEHGVILAASLADRCLRANLGVGLVVNGQRLDWLPPHRGTGHKWEILHMLALASRGETPLRDVLKHIRSNLSHNSRLLIITPNIEINWLQELLSLRRSGITPTIFSLNPRSFGGRRDSHALITALENMGVAYFDIPREMLDRPEATPGTRGRWEWRISATGRAIPVHSADDRAWKRLSK